VTQVTVAPVITQLLSIRANNVLLHNIWLP
jgi:hypothetical protein